MSLCRPFPPALSPKKLLCDAEGGPCALCPVRPACVWVPRCAVRSRLSSSARTNISNPKFRRKMRGRDCRGQGQGRVDGLIMEVRPSPSEGRRWGGGRGRGRLCRLALAPRAAPRRVMCALRTRAELRCAARLGTGRDGTRRDETGRFLGHICLIGIRTTVARTARTWANNRVEIKGTRS